VQAVAPPCRRNGLQWVLLKEHATSDSSDPDQCRATSRESREWKLEQRCSVTYDAPPLVEVAISVQFDAPRELHLAHLGAFWATQKSALPVVRVLQPIPAIVEAFGSQEQWLPPSVQLALTDEPDCRLQMISQDDQWMCQVQRNRLVINWRKRSDQYPRFGTTWDRFHAVWKAWIEFLTDSNVGTVMPRLWELTYVNRIPKEPLWKTPDEWPAVFPGLWGDRFVAVDGAKLRGIQAQWVWESADPQARLYVEPRPGRTRNGEESRGDVLLLSLTARGPVGKVPGELQEANFPDMGPIESGIHFGHDLIVTTFDKTASYEARAFWERHVDVD